MRLTKDLKLPSSLKSQADLPKDQALQDRKP